MNASRKGNETVINKWTVKGQRRSSSYICEAAILYSEKGAERNELTRNELLIPFTANRYVEH